MSQHEAILFANEAFYLAFSTRDIRTMEDIWSREAPVSCIHPGWKPLFGRDAVIESWVTILGNPAAPAVEIREPQVCVYGDTAQIICFEVMQDAILVATNSFVREADGWKLVHHQAGPMAEDPVFTDPPPERPRLQ